MKSTQRRHSKATARLTGRATGSELSATANVGRTRVIVNGRVRCTGRQSNVMHTRKLFIVVAKLLHSTLLLVCLFDRPDITVIVDWVFKTQLLLYRLWLTEQLKINCYY